MTPRHMSSRSMTRLNIRSSLNERPLGSLCVLFFIVGVPSRSGQADPPGPVRADERRPLGCFAGFTGRAGRRERYSARNGIV